MSKTAGRPGLGQVGSRLQFLAAHEPPRVVGYAQCDWAVKPDQHGVDSGPSALDCLHDGSCTPQGLQTRLRTTVRKQVAERFLRFAVMTGRCLHRGTFFIS